MASIKSFKKTSFTDDNLQRLQNNVETFSAPIVNSQIIDGVLIENVELATGSTNIIDHKLGRKPLGYFVVKKNANANIWDSQSTNDRPSLTLELLTSATVTVNLWIF